MLFSIQNFFKIGNDLNAILLQRFTPRASRLHRSLQLKQLFALRGDNKWWMEIQFVHVHLCVCVCATFAAPTNHWMPFSFFCTNSYRCTTGSVCFPSTCRERVIAVSKAEFGISSGLILSLLSLEEDRLLRSRLVAVRLDKTVENASSNCKDCGYSRIEIHGRVKWKSNSWLGGPWEGQNNTHEFVSHIFKQNNRIWLSVTGIR